MKVICGECGEECCAVIVDHGIGPYEYWGLRAVDVQLVVESECCGAECLDESGKEYSVKDIQRLDEQERRLPWRRY